MNASIKYTMTMSLSVLEHLGVNLYSNVPAVISETIANAWDADAQKVEIKFVGNDAEKQIVITDDGSGMTLGDINNKFLIVGYQKRNKDGKVTPRGRIPMGRKGIGKLSLFSIANKIEVHSRKDGEGNALLLDGNEIREKITSGKRDGATAHTEDYHPKDILFDSSFPHENGTKLVIREIKKRVNNVTSVVLRKRLARRFGLKCIEAMEIILDDERIGISDRDYFKNFEHLFYYGDTDAESLCPHLAEGAKEKRENAVENQYHIYGWIGLVPSSKDLTTGDNINKVSIFAREKLAQALWNNMDLAACLLDLSLARFTPISSIWMKKASMILRHQVAKA